MISLVQHKSGNATNSVTLTLSRSTTANNLGVITIMTPSSGATLTAPSGFSAVGSNVGSGSNTLNMYYKVLSGTEGNSFTCSVSGGADARATYLEYSGITTTSPLDKTTTANSGGASVTTLASGSITPSVTNFVIIVSIGIGSASNTWTSWTSGITSEDSANAHRLETGDLVVSGSAGTGSYSTTGTWSASGTATLAIANFIGDGVPHGPTTLNNYQAVRADDNGTGAMSVTEKIR